jgi:hypothetical protein
VTKYSSYSTRGREEELGVAKEFVDSFEIPQNFWLIFSPPNFPPPSQV